MTINLALAEKQGCSSADIVQIERLHHLRDDIHNLIEIAIIHGNRSLTYMLGQSLFPIEAELQKLWKFEVNPAYYQFWGVKGCNCPKMDNRDSYPSGYYYKSSDCWLHWAEEDLLIFPKEE